MEKLILSMACFVLLISGCETPDPQTGFSEKARLHTRITDVAHRDMVDTVTFFGEVELRNQAFLASQFDGRLEAFSLLAGDCVKKGQQIGVIIPPQREALLQVIDQVDEKMRPLVKQQIKSIPLLSPIDAVVIEVWHHQGDVVQKGERMVHLGDIRQLNVYGELPVRFLPLIQKLKTVQTIFVDYPQPPLSLPIEALGGKVDEKAQTISVRLKLDNPQEKYRPGMLTRLAISGEIHHDALVIPREALLEEEGVLSAFVINGKTVEKRILRIGIANSEYAEVLEGLQIGERVAIDNVYSMVDGMEVVVQ